MATDAGAGSPAAILRARHARLHAAIRTRHSRRSFDGTPVPPEDLAALTAFTDSFRPWPGARVAVLREAPQSVFAGIIGSYGGISGAHSALVFIGSRGVLPASVGYTGEAAVLEATALGLDTCWVAGTFSAHVTARLAEVGRDERVFAISPLGSARDATTVKERILFGAARAKRRRSLDEIAPGHEVWPAWGRTAVAAARVAPSAMNRQPWRFRMEGGTLVIAQAGVDTPRASRHLDCGIAMMHAELGALSEGVPGTWELLDGSDVARYVPDGV